MKRMIKWNRDAAVWLERKFPSVFGAPSYQEELESRIAIDIKRLLPSTILEVGGIDRPLLPRSPAYTYIGLDIDEQPDCVNVYDRFIVQSIETPVELAVDMVISITLMEHVPDNVAATREIFATLKPGGTTHHYIPSKWHPYSLALRLVGPALQKRLIAVLRPSAIGVTGYPTFFDHCSPKAMAELFARQGFENIEVKAFYRASDYFAFFLPAYLTVALFENFCSALGWQLFASGFVISAMKPAKTAGEFVEQGDISPSK